jgi:hypothetical protein
MNYMRLHTHPTIAIEELLTGPRQHRTMSDSLRRVYAAIRESGLRPVEWHVEKLGRQDLTWVGSEFRYYVWERPTFRALVANRRGIGVEIRAMFTHRQNVRAARTGLVNYMAAVGL